MSKQAVIILAHGSRNIQARESFVNMVSVVNKRSQRPVVPAFYSLGSPNLEKAVGDLAFEKYSKIIIFPYFLFDGNHVQKDIPSLVSKLRVKHPDIDFQILGSLEHEPMMMEIVLQRIREYNSQPRY
jgi:sirohydrochlorin ferrochelatase